MSASADPLAVDAPAVGFVRGVTAVVEALAAALIVIEIGVLGIGVFCRYVLHTPLIWTDELASTLFLWLVMLGAVIALQRGEHMRLGFVVGLMTERRRRIAQAFGSATIVLFLIVILAPAYHRFDDEWPQLSPVMEISSGWRAASMMAGFAVMLVLALLSFLRDCDGRDILVSVAALLGIGVVLWLASPFLIPLGKYNLTIFFVVLLGGCVILGVPIAFSFGLVTCAYLGLCTRVPLSVVVGRIDEGASSTILLSVPLFILLGYLIEITGMARAMVGFLAALLGHVKGGLYYVLLSGMYLVSGISGAKAADMAAIVPVLFPEMKRRGSKPGELIGVLASSAAMAETIPPSLVLIALGSVAGVSIASLFAAGFLPALVLALVLGLLARYRARNDDMTGIERPSMRAVGWAFVVAIPALILPLLIRTLVAEGVTTATEVSTVGILYALGLGLLLYRKLELRALYTALVATASLSGAILLIVGAASAMAWALSQSGFSRDIVSLVVGMPGGRISFLLASIVLFVVLGSILEGLPALILFAPLLFPAARAIGIHDVHYSMIIVLAMGVGLFSPPFGVGYYIACAIGKVSPDRAMGSIWLYMAALIVGLLLITFIPAISLVFV